MKRFIFILGFMIFLIFLSCKSRETQTSLNDTNVNAKYDNFKFQFKDFESFYEKFISDSIYQISRTKFPIKGCYEGLDDKREWTKDNWPLMKWDLRQEIKETSDSLVIEQYENKFFFGSYCRGCGFSFEMEFEKTDNEWFLTYRQENNF